MTRRATLFLVAILACGGRAWTWPGDLDPGFGTHGRVITDFGGSDTANTALVEADGHIVVAGSSTDSGSTTRFALARYDASGTLDPSFGDGGKVLTAVGSNASIHALALQTDGKLIAAGYGSDAMFLVRYDASGIPDSGFGAGGIVTISNTTAEGVAVVADGKILAAGRSGTDVAVARFDDAGNLDPTFGTGGIVITDVGGTHGAAPMVLTVEPEGHFLVGATTGPIYDTTTHMTVVVARYDADGTLDATFGNGGVVQSADFMGLIHRIAIAPDGKLLATGPPSPGYFFFAVARYNADGTPDAGFGSGDIVVSSFGGDYSLGDEPFTVFPQADGKVIVGGRGVPRNGFDGYFGLLRYEADGSIDRTFAPCGGVLTSFPHDGGVTALEAQMLVSQPDGKLLALGSKIYPGPNHFLLARYAGGSAPSACEQPVSGKSTILLRPAATSHYPGHPNTLRWVWKGTNPVDAADFGDPPTGTDLVTCVMDETIPAAMFRGLTAPFVTGAVVPANPDVSCVALGCQLWRANRKGYAFSGSNPTGLEGRKNAYYGDGVTRVKLVAGAAGKGTIRVAGADFGGIDYGQPKLPLTPPVLVRLAREDGSRCWEATFSTPHKRSDTGFSAKSD